MDESPEEPMRLLTLTLASAVTMAGCLDVPAPLDLTTSPAVDADDGTAGGDGGGTQTAAPMDTTDVAEATETSADETAVVPDLCGVLPVDITPQTTGSAVKLLAGGLDATGVAGLTVLPSGDVVATGRASGKRIWLGRIGSDGSVKGSLVIGDAAVPGALVQLQDGRLLVGGREGESTLLVAVGVTSDGLEPLSEHRFHRQQASTVSGMSPTADGGAIFVGRLVQIQPGQKRPWWMVKLRADLSTEWDSTFEGTHAHDVLADGKGGFVSVGTRTFDDTTLDDAWLIRTDADGQMLANREFMADALHDKAHALSTWDYGFVVAGETESHGCGAQDGMLMRVSAEGTAQSAPVVVGGPGSDTLTAMVRTGDRWVAVGSRQQDGDKQAWCVVMDDQLQVNQYAFLSGDPSRFDSVAAFGADGAVVMGGTGYSGDEAAGFVVVSGPEGALQLAP